MNFSPTETDGFMAQVGWGLEALSEMCQRAKNFDSAEQLASVEVTELHRMCMEGVRDM